VGSGRRGGEDASNGIAQPSEIRNSNESDENTNTKRKTETSSAKCHFCIKKVGIQYPHNSSRKKGEIQMLSNLVSMLCFEHMASRNGITVYVESRRIRGWPGVGAWKVAWMKVEGGTAGDAPEDNAQPQPLALGGGPRNNFG